MHRPRNRWRSLPCSPCRSASSEQARDAGVPPLVVVIADGGVVDRAVTVTLAGVMVVAIETRASAVFNTIASLTPARSSWSAAAARAALSYPAGIGIGAAPWLHPGGEPTRYPRQNPVARALREIGRVERTLFILDWLDDPEQRRRTGTILNKGEARNALARAIFFNRLGELRDRTFETSGTARPG